MRLSDLLSVLEIKETLGNLDKEISGIAYDSRKISAHNLFVAVPGFAQDGTNFVREALEGGAAAIVAEHKIEGLDPELCQIIVPSARSALAGLANKFYDFPSLKLKTVGITGTKGKTTTAYLLENVLNLARFTTGMIGTVETRIRGESIPSKMTTPESLDLQDLLFSMLKAEVTHVILEVTSHALTLERIKGTEFDVVVHTNITSDHLDFHKTVENYVSAKLKLFQGLNKNFKKDGVAVINLDDPWSGKIIENTQGRIITYGIEKPADIMAENIYAGLSKTSFTLKTPAGTVSIRSELFGSFNIYNMLATTAAALVLGIDLDIIRLALEKSRPVPGRFELIDAGQEFKVVVDFAHTADSLEKLLKTARFITRNHVILVFGCPGDRDKTKRPIMGGIAARLADFSIITTDNPKNEDSVQIIQEIEKGVKEFGGIEGKNYIKLDGRKNAIKKAISLAKSGDTVVIAGRGPEPYQEFGNVKIELDDREAAREYCERWVKQNIKAV